MIKPHHIMVEPHYIMIKPHHIMTKPHHIMTKPHHIMTKPHHIMTKPHHIMMYQNYNMTKLHHITTKRQHIMIIDHIRKLWLSIGSLQFLNFLTFNLLSRSLYFKKFREFKLSFDARQKKNAGTFFSGFENPQTKEGYLSHR